MNELLRPIKRICLQLLFLLGCYFLSRCVFTLVHLAYFEGLSFPSFLWLCAAALRFDISALVAVNLLYFVLLLFPYPALPGRRQDRLVQGVFICSNLLALLFELSDWAYFPFNHKRATAEVLDMIFRKGDFLNLLPRFLAEFWYIPLAALAFLAGMILLNKRICLATASKPGQRPAVLLRVLRLVLVAGLSVVAIRGGIQLVPIGIRNAVQVTESRYVPIVLNTPFSIITTFQNDNLKEEKYYDEATLKQYINTTKQYTGKSFRPKNVVVIILESFSKEFTGIGGMKSYTPFLDSMMGQSLTCTNAFANGYHSAEGIPAILAGIPSLQEEPFTTSAYGANRITSLPNLLAKKGYSSAFYHGGTNGTMSFDLFAANAGFQRYLGRSEYPNPEDYDGTWGIWDEPFLQFAAEDMSQHMKEPFCASVFTLSSHHPFAIPRQYKGRFPKGKLDIQESIGYTDYALRRFFHTASRQPWFNNTLFVIVPDHCSCLSEDEYYSYYQGRFAIPVLYYAPGDSSLKGTYPRLTQQIDILPSVMDYLGYPQPFFAFGSSIFRSNEPRYTVQYWTGSIYWTMNQYFLQTTNDKLDGFFHTENDKLRKYNIWQEQDSLLQVSLRYSRAMKQAYSHAMIYNQLWVK